MKVEKFKVLLYLKKSGLDKNGKAPIMGRITVNNTMAQFSCKVSCTPNLWSARDSRLVGKSREAVEVNEKLDKLELSINSAFESLISKHKDFCAKDVKELMQGSMQTQMTFLKMVDRVNDELKGRIGVDRSPKTYSAYHYNRLNLGEFIETKYKMKDLAFGQLTEQFIHDYQNYVIDERGYAIETVRHYLAIIKKVCRLAFKAGYADKLHFKHFILPRETRRTPRALSRESFEKIRDIEIPECRKAHRIARDLFLFGCYTGVSYADVVSITEDNIFIGEDGSKWLKYCRQKNGHRASVKLLPEALDLIDKHHDDSRKTLFPLMHHANLSRHLKALRELAGIKENLCYHMGRHSFASLITLEAGVSIETISKMLGHNKIRTTQVYAQVTPQKLFDDMDVFIEATKDLRLIL